MQNKWDRARQFLLSDQLSVPASTYWNTLCQDEGLGRLLARRWHLTEEEKQTLRAIVTRETSTDPCLSELPQDRMAQAREASDEKLAREPVFAKLMLVAKRDSPIQMKDGRLGATPAGTCLAVPEQQLDLSAETHIIVVENGSAIQHWHQVKVPEAWSHALWCYRGHGSNAAALARLLKNNSHAHIAWYCDLDPAGLVLAMHAQHLMLVPQRAVARSFATDFLTKYSKLPAFLMQQKFSMPHTHVTSRHDLWEYVQSKKIAITQEAMITAGLQMVVI